MHIHVLVRFFVHVRLNLYMVLWVFKSDMAIISSIPQIRIKWRWNSRPITWERMGEISWKSWSSPFKKMLSFIPFSFKPISLDSPFKSRDDTGETATERNGIDVMELMEPVPIVPGQR
jgi:hypothetical protein